jgi:hypothetical protein
MAVGTAGLYELEGELIILQCFLPDPTQTNDSHSLGVSIKAIKMARDVVIIAMKSDPLNARSVAAAVETTERAHTLQEFTLRRVNGPTYGTNFTYSSYVCQV